MNKEDEQNERRPQPSLLFLLAAQKTAETLPFSSPFFVVATFQVSSFRFFSYWKYSIDMHAHRFDISA